MEKLEHSMQSEDCAACRKLLEDVHADLVYWFTSKVKPRFKTLHVQVGYRDTFQQERAKKGGASCFSFPYSPHNARDPVDLLPSSQAIDLVQLDPLGQPVRNSQIFMDVHEKCLDDSSAVITGLDCKERGLYNHFELIPPANRGRVPLST